MSNLVSTNQRGENVTTTVIVAKTFGKNHIDVFKDVQHLSSSDQFFRRNFTPLDYTIRGKKYSMFEMTKDGFFSIVMGYTGVNATEFRETFITEFNKPIINQPVLKTKVMNEIIKITEYDGRKVASARELHYFLESKQDFSTWIKGRIQKYDLIENEDYVLLHNFVEQVSGGKYQIEYALTLDAAKELSMVEGNAKGKQARKYFIECEKELRELSLKPIENDTPEMIMARGYVAAMAAIESHKEKMKVLEIVIEQKDKRLELQEFEIKQAAPKVEYYRNVLQSESLIVTNVIAKELGMSAVTLNARLHKFGIIYKSGETWVLYHQYQNKGLTGTKTHTYTNSLGHEKTSVQTYWTEKGRKFIHGVFSLQETA